MKQAILGIVLSLFMGMVGSYCVLRAQDNTHLQDNAHPRPRFEKVLEETNNESVYTANFIVWHDKETGQETVCYMSGNRTGCWLTGRTWK